MIKIENLVKKFSDNTVLNGLNLFVEKGEIYGFIGKNGAGKTTTMNILAGLWGYDGGLCVVGNTEIMPNRYETSKICGYLPEEPKFYPYMSAREYLKLLGLINGQSGAEIRKRTDELLELVGLSDRANRKVGGYSRGMKQRLGLAAELYNNPQVLLLDEPSSALDPVGRADMVKILNDLKAKGVTIMLSTHILSDMEHICDRVGILSGGKTVLEGDLDDILKQYVTSGYDISLQKPPSETDIESVKALNFINEIKISENEIFLDTAEPESNINALFDLLAKFSVPVMSVSVRRANLDEVFRKVAL